MHTFIACLGGALICLFFCWLLTLIPGDSYEVRCYREFMKFMDKIRHASAIQELSALDEQIEDFLNGAITSFQYNRFVNDLNRARNKRRDKLRVAKKAA